METDVKTMTIEQLKALAWDTQIIAQKATGNLRVIMTELKRREETPDAS